MTERTATAAVDRFDVTPDGGLDINLKVDTGTAWFEFRVTVDAAGDTHLESSRVDDDTGDATVLHAETIAAPRRRKRRA